MIGCGHDIEPESGDHAQSQETAKLISTETISSISFRDATDRSNVSFMYRNGVEADQFAILQSLGGGGAICDFDRSEERRVGKD